MSVESRDDDQVALAGLDRLATIVEAINDDDPDRALCATIAAVAAGLRAAVIAVLERREDRFALVAGRGWPDAETALRLPMAVVAAASAATVFELDELDLPAAAEGGAGPALIVAIPGDGAPWGALIVGGFDPAGRGTGVAADAAAAGFLTAAARVLGAALAARRRAVALRRDVSSREASNARYRQSLRASRAGAWEWSVTTGEVIWSEENFAVLGLDPTRTEASHQAWLAVVHPDDRAEAAATVAQCVADGRDLDLELRVVHGDGQIRWIRDVGKLVTDDSGAAVKMCGIQIDVTERRDAEEARRQAEERAAAAERLEALGRLAGGIAHDFNNVLTAIAMSANIARSMSAGAELAEDLDAVLEAAARAATLTRQLQAFGRRGPLAPETSDLVERIGDLAPMLRRLIAEDVRVTIDLPKAPLYAVVDRGQLDQVVLNLTVNARDSMPGGGALEIRLRPIVLGATTAAAHRLAPGPFAYLTVSDSGHGIDDQTRRHLFEPYYTTKPHGRGTGLGLATVHGLVHQLGGAIMVDSVVGAGTTFGVLLAATADGAVSPPPATEEVAGQTGRILVVEDDARVLELIERALEHHGHTVVTTTSPVTALELVGSATHGFDLIVIDVVMARMSGTDLVELIRRRHADARCLFISGHLPATLAHDAVGADDESVLTKPFTAAELARRVADCLARR